MLTHAPKVLLVVVACVAVALPASAGAHARAGNIDDPARYPTLAQVVDLEPRLAGGHAFLSDYEKPHRFVKRYFDGRLTCRTKSFGAGPSTTMAYGEGSTFIDQSPFRASIAGTASEAEARRIVRQMRRSVVRCGGTFRDHDQQKVQLRPFRVSSSSGAYVTAWQVEGGYEQGAFIYAAVGDELLGVHVYSHDMFSDPWERNYARSLMSLLATTSAVTP